MNVELAEKVLQEKLKLLAELQSQSREITSALAVWDMRAEREKVQYELEVMVTRHLQGHGGTDHLDEREEKEEEARQKQTNASSECSRLWMCKRKAEKEIRRLQGDVEILTRISKQWEVDVNGLGSSLFEELSRPDIDESLAFRNVGLQCRCDNSLCEFPFVVDDGHDNL